MNPRLAVISFPGNNCEVESLRAAERNGFDAKLILWNEPEKLADFDAYFLIGGFSFEDRGRSGAIAAREPIFDVLRSEAQKGKIILGVCNGAQMIVESGLIPIGDNPVPFALAENIRRDTSEHVLGTGYYNEWVHLTLERKDTAFTGKAQNILRVPIAHGEGRFTSRDKNAQEALLSGKNVAFRYCDKKGVVSDQFPITPNGAFAATAMVVNDEGTIGAIMPHPERFYDAFDGDQIFQSMNAWISEHRSPKSVGIGKFETSQVEKIDPLSQSKNSLFLEKKLIITDNEAFSVSQAASSIAGEKMHLEKSWLYSIEFEPKNSQGSNSEMRKKILDSGLILNENKEVLLPDPSPKDTSSPRSNKYAVFPLEDDTATALGEKLSTLLKRKVRVKIYTCWNFKNTSEKAIKKVFQNRLLANPNAAQIFAL